MRARLARAARRAWRLLREWSGDAAYETYVARAARAGDRAPLGREQFYLDTLRRRYRHPNRCC